MKSLQFLTYLFVFVFCVTSCSKQVETDLAQAETEINEEDSAVERAPSPYIYALTNNCGPFGPYASVVVKYANHHSTVHLDVYRLNIDDEWVHHARYTRSNPNYYATLNFTVGYPTNGSKDCTILNAGTNYRIKANAGIQPPFQTWSWGPLHPYKIDDFTTLTPCDCVR